MVHYLVEGEIIGLGYAWYDYVTPGRVVQKGGGPWQAFYKLSQHDQMYRSAEGACDFYLSPVEDHTAVDATTWGRIKAGFSE